MEEGRFRHGIYSIRRRLGDEAGKLPTQSSSSPDPLQQRGPGLFWRREGVQGEQEGKSAESPHTTITRHKARVEKKQKSEEEACRKDREEAMPACLGKQFGTHAMIKKPLKACLPLPAGTHHLSSTTYVNTHGRGRKRERMGKKREERKQKAASCQNWTPAHTVTHCHQSMLRICLFRVIMNFQ